MELFLSSLKITIRHTASNAIERLELVDDPSRQIVVNTLIGILLNAPNAEPEENYNAVCLVRSLEDEVFIIFKIAMEAIVALQYMHNRHGIDISECFFEDTPEFQEFPE
jgi:hypothetical protein